MAIVVLQLPDVKQERNERPQQCPYCAGVTFQRWGGGEKPVRDVHCRRVWVYRYRGGHCGRTFRHYPAGSSRADQTERLKRLAVVCWTLGLSHRSVSRILSGLQVRLSPMSVWRDAQEQAEQIRQHHRWRKVGVLGVDGALVTGWGDKRPVLVAVDLGAGQVVEVGQVNEYDLHAVVRWLQGLVQRLGVKVIVTDDLYVYRTVSEQLPVGHQVCQFHARRWIGKTLKALHETVPKDWQWVLGEVEELIEFLPPEGDKRLYALWKQLGVRRTGRGRALSAVEQLRDLLLRLSQRWASYCTFQGEPQVPWTNNRSEQAIGRMKMRARTVRGYKTWKGMQTGLLLAGGFQF